MLRAMIAFGSQLWKSVSSGGTLHAQVFIRLLHAVAMGEMAHRLTGQLLDGAVVVLILLAYQHNALEIRKVSLLVVLLILLYQPFVLTTTVTEEKYRAEGFQWVQEWIECAHQALAHVQGRAHSPEVETQLRKMASELWQLTFIDAQMSAGAYGPRVAELQHAIIRLFDSDGIPADWKFPANRILNEPIGVPEELAYLWSHWKGASASIFVGQLLLVLVLAYLVQASHKQNEPPASGAKGAQAPDSGDTQQQHENEPPHLPKEIDIGQVMGVTLPKYGSFLPSSSKN
jgi:hypothetical protein